MRSPACPSTTRPAPSAAILAARGRRDRRRGRRRHPGRARVGLVGEDPAAAGRARAAPGPLRALRARRRRARPRCAQAADELRRGYPALAIDAHRADFAAPSGPAAGRGRRAGRVPRQHDRELRAGRAAAVPGGAARLSRRATHFLLGTDLVKPRTVLVARLRRRRRGDRRVQPQRAAGAQPPAGRRLRRRTRSATSRVWDADAGVDRDAAAGDPGDACPCPSSALTVEFADGEEMRTEISAKFRREAVARGAGRGRVRPPRAGGPIRGSGSPCPCGAPPDRTPGRRGRVRGAGGRQDPHNRRTVGGWERSRVHNVGTVVWILVG